MSQVSALVRITLATVAAVTVTGCTLPRVPFVPGYHEVTVTDSGRIYCTDRLRCDGSVVEFEDGKTGAWLSAATSTTRSISAAEYRSCIDR